MKEEDAKTKWCPQAAIEKSIRLQSLTMCAVASPNSKSILRDMEDNSNDGSQKCIASDCAMWVWDAEKNKAMADDAGSLDIEFEGYCGLIHQHI